MSTYRTGGHWGRTIVLEGDMPADEDGRRPDDELVGMVDTVELAQRIVRLLNAGKGGGPRSRLGDLIVMHGAYAVGQVVPNPVMRFLESTELNALRDELIALRGLATGGDA